MVVAGFSPRGRAVGFDRRPCLQAGQWQPCHSSEGAVVLLV